MKTRLAMLVVALAVPGALAAQDTTSADRPFVRGGVYDKPYLTTLLGRTALGGYAEFHSRFERVDGLTEEFGFEAKRFNLFASTQVSDFVRIGSELEIEEGGDEIKLEFAAIDVSISRALRFRGGMLLSPLGRFNLSHDSPLNEFTDRPLVSTEILGTALSEPGLGALGEFRVGESGRITYEVYAVNGFHDGLVTNSPDGTRIPNGRRNFEDNNRAPAVVGRVTWSPGLRYEVGLSAHRGQYNVSHLDGTTVDEGRGVTIAVIDFEADLTWARISGELATARIDIPAALVGLYAERQRGAYVELLRDFGEGWVPTMPSSHLTAGFRVDLIDLDGDLAGDSMRQITAGLNFRPTPDSAVKFDLVRGRSRDRFNSPADHFGVQLSIATYY